MATSRFLVTIEFVVDADVDDIDDAAMDIAESAAAASEYTVADWAITDVVDYDDWVADEDLVADEW